MKTVTHKNETYTLKEDAYMENYGIYGEVRYYAHATDADGTEVIVVWLTTQIWDEATEAAAAGDNNALSYIEDESNACEWDYPEKITQI